MLKRESTSGKPTTSDTSTCAQRLGKRKSLCGRWVCLLGLLTGHTSEAPAQEATPSAQVPRERASARAAKVPAKAILLFNGGEDHLLVSKAGTSIDWPIKDRSLISTPGKHGLNHVVSRLHFRNARIHVEFLLPEASTGNSGIYIHGHYEMQILNSFAKKSLGSSDMGALYGFFSPRINACLEPGRWQSYDIEYRAPLRRDDGSIVKLGSITALLNGKKVQDNVRFGEPRSAYHPFRYSTTPYLKAVAEQQRLTMAGPLILQDHGSPVRFRNIWVLPRDASAFMYQPE